MCKPSISLSFFFSFSTVSLKVEKFVSVTRRGESICRGSARHVTTLSAAGRVKRVSR